MKYIFVFLALSVITVISSKSQDIEFKKKNFSDANGFDVAIKNIKSGDEYFSKQKKWLYQQALGCYLKANEFNPNNAILNFKIGVCYLNSSDKASSLYYFLKAHTLKPDVDPKIDYAIAQGYHYNLQFDEAISYYEKAMKALNIKSSDMKIEKITSFVMIIDKKIAECKSGKLLVANPLKIHIENLGPVINSKYSDYVSLVTSDESQMIFTSRREGSTGGEVDQNGLEYFEDVYQSTKNQEKWGYPQQILGAVNTTSHDASVGLSSDGKTLFIYRGLINGGDLYECKNEGGNWTVPKVLNRINTSYHETSACITNDGKTLYLTSDRQDKTIGMRDIFVSHLDNNGDWSEPENLGVTVNTIYDEEGVSLSSDGNSIYFSSTGHNTMGGFDIFKSTFQNGAWSIPENMGYPLNTPDDEMYLQVIDKESLIHGYFSATRKEGIGSSDIYCYQNIQEQAVLKVAVDTSENPENYRIPIEGGDPANLFVNVINDSASNKQITVNTNNETNKKDVVSTEVKKEIPIDNSKEQIVTPIRDENKTVENPVEKVNEEALGNAKSESEIAFGNVVFKVQVGACHRQIPQYELRQRYPGNKKVSMETHEGWYKYVIGSFNKYSEAKTEKLSCGTSDAWIVVYKDGKRVPISEVTNFLALYPINKQLIAMLL